MELMHACNVLALLYVTVIIEIFVLSLNIFFFQNPIKELMYLNERYDKALINTGKPLLLKYNKIINIPGQQRDIKYL